jgi:hypothetical protein
MVSGSTFCRRRPFCGASLADKLEKLADYLSETGSFGCGPPVKHLVRIS